MRQVRVRLGFCWLAVLVLAVAGCEDPSNVGLGIIGEEASEPTRIHLAGADLPSERDPVVTGGIRSGITFSGAGRVLFGTAEDPLFGLMQSKGYVDYSAPLALASNFRDGTVTAVSLHFVADGYVYGDTSATATFVISDMPEAWTAFGVRSDTLLVSSDPVTSFDYTYSEGEFVVPLPEDWVQKNGSTLLDPDFINAFDGFEIVALSPSAITGIGGVESFMRVTTTTGTEDYVMSKLLTALSKVPGPSIEGRTPVQDGYGDNAILDFDFEIDSIAGSAISRAVVDIRVDLSPFEDAPPDFVRPVPVSIDLIGIREDGTRRSLRSVPILADGKVSFISTTASAGEFTLVRSVQLAVTGSSQFEKYAVTVAQPQAAIDAVLIYNASALEDQPEAVVTLVLTPF